MRVAVHLSVGPAVVHVPEIDEPPGPPVVYGSHGGEKPIPLGRSECVGVLANTDRQVNAADSRPRALGLDCHVVERRARLPPSTNSIVKNGPLDTSPTSWT